MKNLVAQIDQLLPQTQCGQCNYDGCLPYAEAIADGEAINRCPPGGVKTLNALADLLKRDAKPFLEEMISQEKLPATAYIRETECIGCTKCIQACPVDAILGGAKQLHTVLTQECTGCGLCVAPCPVDCIDIISLKTPAYQPKKTRQRFYARKQRLSEIKRQAVQQKKNEETNNQRTYIEAAIARSKAKKINTSVTA
ncbi:RnfABCDGE type electron transport complex subunit B [Rickettsiella endosymbiont of Dermanyssus gallinae]|uniref:RnfABCDGE type electron transport complex subunit B n=1 Tax=Rickettsiella endosymbiont of Dermanyssus gallinae TaxID=2856608 RepID=UPI001C52F311|nr:RnfABCDGE type electron transport complex subunit B [Rickettsiella endosymbiont of Dermanyssus gallinae]